MTEQYVKVFLHNDYDDVESLPCEPCGEADGRKLFRLRSVPFLHSKPTYADVIPAAIDEELGGCYAWNGKVEGVHEDGGRYAMIFDWEPSSQTGANLDGPWLPQELDIIPNNAWAACEGKAGRTYLAVPHGMNPDQVMAELCAGHPGLAFILIHPEP